MTRPIEAEPSIVAEIVTEAIIRRRNLDDHLPNPREEFTYYIEQLRDFAIDPRLVELLNSQLRSSHLRIVTLFARADNAYDGHVVLVYAAHTHHTRL